MSEETTLNEEKTAEEESLTQKLDELHDAYYRRFWKLEQNSDALPAPAVKFMQDVLYKQYVRDYELLMGEYGIETDKKIEELKIERDKEIEAVKLEHEKLTAGIEEKRTAQNNEISLAAAVADKEHKMKLDEVVPDDLPKRWWQRKPRPNYAKRLAMQEVGIIVEDYFAKREQEIAMLEDRPAEIEALLKESLPCPRGRRARRRWEEEIAIVAATLERKLRCQEEAREQLGEAIRAADEATPAETFEEPQDNSEQQETPEQEEPAKPKRKRQRKTPNKPREDEAQDGQLTGQVSMEELNESEEPKQGNADKPEEGAE